MTDREFTLAAEICTLMERRHASGDEGTAAIALALIVSMVDSKISKEQTIKMFDELWDGVAPLIEKRARALKS